MKPRMSATVAAVSTLTALACSQGPSQTVSYDVGGAVVYALDEGIALEGVAVALTNRQGVTFETTSDDSGFWVLEAMEPGLYTEEYSLEGYETHVAKFGLEAKGAHDIQNTFVSRGTIGLPELGLRATLGTPFQVELENGDVLIHSPGGNELVYSNSVDAFIQLVFTLPLRNGYVSLSDGVTWGWVAAQPNTDNTMWTFSKADLMGMNNGNPLTADIDPNTLHQIYISGEGVTKIHGDRVAFDAEILFDCVP